MCYASVMRHAMLVMWLVGCSTPESFGERYEAAFCANISACAEPENEAEWCDGYMAGMWTPERCADWTPDPERDQACLDALASETCDSQAACDRELFGCD